MRLRYKLLGIASAVIITISGVSIYNLNIVINKNSQSQIKEENLLSSIKDTKKDLQDSIDSAKSLNIDKSQVSDEKVISNLNDIVSSSINCLNTEPNDTSTSKWYNAFSEKEDLVKNQEFNEELLSSLNEKIKSLNSSVSSVEQSKLTKDISYTKTSLSNLLSKAKDELASSDGNVSDEGTRECLSREISGVEDSLNSDDISESFLSSLSKYQETLQAKIDDVDNSVKEQQEIIKQEQEQLLEAGYGSYQTDQSSEETVQSNDTWYVDYTDGWHTYDLGTGVTQWNIGYYVAHSNTESGRIIASIPDSVVVDGISYYYVSSTSVYPGTCWEDVEGFVHDNGGIGFQTCQSNGTYLITHYEPY